MDLTEKAKEKYQEKIKMLTDKGINVEMQLMMNVGPSDTQLIMKQFEAMFVSGFYEGLAHVVSSAKET